MPRTEITGGTPVPLPEITGGTPVPLPEITGGTAVPRPCRFRLTVTLGRGRLDYGVGNVLFVAREKIELHAAGAAEVRDA